MITIKQYFIYIILACLIALGGHYLLLFLEILALPFQLIVLLSFIIFFQFIGAGLIATIGDLTPPEAFAQRFLVLTTFQLFTIMITLLAVGFKTKLYFKEFLVQFMGVFVVLMIVQSVLLIKLGKNIKK